MKPLIFLVVGRVLSFSVLLSISMAGAIHLDLYLFRWRAERLQADIRLLQMRKSTHEDVRKFETRWFDDAKEGVCKPYWCDLQIALNNPDSRKLEFLANHPALFSIYRILGGRVATVYADIRVRDNLLLEKMLRLTVESRSIDGNGRRVTYALKGMVGTSPLTFVSARHPEFEIGAPSGCSACKAVWVKFTSFADPHDVLRLTDINFDCITRWSPCTDEADILPSAWKEWQDEIANPAQARFDLCSPDVIRVLTRESRRVILATVIALEHSDEAGTLVMVRRVPKVEGLNAHQWRKRPVRLSSPDAIAVGKRVLVFDNDACAAAPATQINVAAARQGVSEAWVSPVRSVGLPGTINPPAIDVR